MWKWVILVALIIAGGLLIVFRIQLAALERDPSKIHPDIQAAGKIPLRHSYESGIHRYRGQITLEHSCYSVETRVVRDHRTPDTAILYITTTDITIRQPTCTKIKTPYVFDVVINEPDATRRLALKLFVNGVEHDYVLIESSWSDPTNSVIVPVAPFAQ